MKGIFGDMFDLNGSGGLDPAELAGDYALADEVLNEDENAEEAAECSGMEGGDTQGTVTLHFTYEVTVKNDDEEDESEEDEEFKTDKDQDEKKERNLQLKTDPEFDYNEQDGWEFELTVYLPALEPQMEKVAAIYSRRTMRSLSDVKEELKGAENLSLLCSSLGEAQQLKGELEKAGAVVQLVRTKQNEVQKPKTEKKQAIKKAERVQEIQKSEATHQIQNAMPETRLVGEQVTSVTEKPIASEKKYLYCRVKFSSGQSSFYLSDDKTIKPGDFVTALYGRKVELVQTGEVCDIYECTEENAFHPPQLMRHIIGRSVRPHGWMEPPEPIRERRAAYKRKLKEEEARRRLEGNPKQAEEDNKCII